MSAKVRIGIFTSPVLISVFIKKTLAMRVFLYDEYELKNFVDCRFDLPSNSYFVDD